MDIPNAYRPIQFRYNDGGRANAGYSGSTDDCVARAIAIVTGKSYVDVYVAINTGSL
jgi:hypothetical protein